MISAKKGHVMGGRGSGQQLFSKRLTRNYRKLDVRALQRQGYLKPGNSMPLQWWRHGKVIAGVQMKAQSDSVSFEFLHCPVGNNDWLPKSCLVWLEWTDCNYGGQRTWFSCPLCGACVAILYLGSGSIACRHCRQLAYPSQRENASGRAIQHANNIRDKLGWQPGIIHGVGNKPKGMHWKTYWHLLSEYEQATLTAIRGWHL